MARDSSSYMTDYEAYLPILQGIAGLGDTSSLKDRMQEKSNYNSGILDAQAKEEEDVRQTTANYRWVDNPALAGYGINDRARLKESDVSGNRAEANSLGLMYTARQGDLKAAIDGWKEAWQAKYNASKEGAEGSKSLYDMAFGKEKQAEEVRQFNEKMAQDMQIAQLNASTRGGGGGGSEKDPNAEFINDVEGMKKTLGKAGGGLYAREQIIGAMQQKYGGSAAANQDISDRIYGNGKYAGNGLAPNNWEKAYVSSSSSSPWDGLN